jgi:ABC-type transport system substrate-binding protein
MRWIPTKLDALAGGLAAAAIALVSLPLGCGTSLPAPIPSAHEGDPTPRRGGTLRLASSFDITNLDPAGPSNGLAHQATLLIFDGLVDYDFQGRMIPRLAERWEVADEGRTYRFFVRAGVTMQDGEELTAEDVKRSAERSLHPTASNGVGSYYAGILGYGAFADGKAEHLDGIVVEGRYVVAFHLAEPDAAFLPLLATPALRPVCRTAGTRYSSAWRACGAGPFQLDAGGWARGASLRLVRFPGYFRTGLPYLDAVEWTFLMDQVPQLFRFEEGSVDLLINPTENTVARFRADARWKGSGITQFENTIDGEAMNTHMPPFDNVEVRRAVASAFDRNNYAMLKPSTLSPLTEVLPRSVPGYDASFVGQRYDLAAALEHMRKAGYPYDPTTGRGGWPHPIVYTVYDASLYALTAQVLQQDLAKIGLRIEMRMVSYPAYLAITQRPGGTAISPQGDNMTFPDPSSFFDELFASDAIRADGSSNMAFYSNQRLDALLARGHRELDPDIRRSIYREANELVCDEAPWAFTFGQHDFAILQPYVKGFAPHPIWPLDLREVWLDRPDADAARALSGGLR